MTAKKRVRRAGGRWRLLIHDWRGRAEGYGTAHDLRNYKEPPLRPLDFTDEQYARYAAEVTRRHEEAVAKGWSKDHDLLGTEFDELVVGNWLHVEQMDTGYWWMNVGGVTVHVRADRDGRPTWVRVHGPGDYDDPVDGCDYELNWSRDGES